MIREAVSFNGSVWQVNIRDEADKSILAEIFKLREYRVAEDIIKQASQLILDVGAHSGFFTLYARSLNRTVPIIAVEPEDNNIEFFKKHLAQNRVENVRLVSGALGGKSGRRKLLISADSHNHRLLGEHESQGDGQDIKIVPVFTIDAIIKKFGATKVDLIKMDIEGGEYEVLETLTPKVYALVGAFILEYHNYSPRHYKELEETLRENGFGVQIFPSKFDNRMGFIFARNKRK